MKAYVLIETMADNANISEQQILNIFNSKDKAVEQMRHLIKEDKHGVIACNGVRNNKETYFSTYFADLILEYSVEEYNVI